MIIGIGTDLISVKRIENILRIFNQKFIKKIFTNNEINFINSKKSDKDNLLRQSLFYAKRFSAKEAFSKAIGLGIGRGIDFCDIEIVNDNLGKPQINLLNNKEEFLRKHLSIQNFSIHLTLSDEKEYAIATVIIEKIS